MKTFCQLYLRDELFYNNSEIWQIQKHIICTRILYAQKSLSVPLRQQPELILHLSVVQSAHKPAGRTRQPAFNPGSESLTESKPLRSVKEIIPIHPGRRFLRIEGSWYLWGIRRGWIRQDLVEGKRVEIRVNGGTTSSLRSYCLHSEVKQVEVICVLKDS